MGRIEIDLFDVAHVKAEFIPVPFEFLGRFVWSTHFLHCGVYTLLKVVFHKNNANLLDRLAQCIKQFQWDIFGFLGNSKTWSKGLCLWNIQFDLFKNKTQKAFKFCFHMRDKDFLSRSKEQTLLFKHTSKYMSNLRNLDMSNDNKIFLFVMKKLPLYRFQSLD